MLKQLKQLLKLIFSDARQGIVGSVAFALIVYLWGILPGKSKIVPIVSTAIINTQTPLWATIALFFVLGLYVTLKFQQYSKHPPIEKRPKIISAVGTDPKTDLIIKSISEEQDGLKTIQDILRETNLPLKTINQTVDWLYMNDFISEGKGRNGKVFVLTPEGRKTFSQIINR